MLTLRYYGGEMKIGDGYGSCSSAETKYAFRWVSEGKLPKNIDKEVYKTVVYNDYITTMPYELISGL